MKTIQFKSVLATIAMLLAVTALSGQKAEKEIQKDFAFNNGFLLSIDNKYGSIEVLNWDKKSVSVHIKITAKSSTQQKAEELIEKVNIDITEEKNAAYFDTEFDLKGLNGKSDIKIEYLVNAPKELNVSLEQKYGNIYIQELTGEADVEVKYGNLEAGTLIQAKSDGWNSIEVAYGNGSIVNAGLISAKVKYGELSIEDSKSLSIESAYSKVYLGAVKALSIESKYDKVKIDELMGEVSIESAYTQVNLGNINADFKSIEAEMTYGNLKGSLSGNASFEITASTQYGEINIPAGDYKVSKDGNSRFLEGKMGSGAGKIDVSLKYGNLTLE